MKILKNLKIKKMKNYNLQFKIGRYYLLFAFFVALFFVFGAEKTKAATLYLSPASGDYMVENILTVNIIVNTKGEVINSADAVINFPQDLLEIVSVNKSGSIFSLWVEEPSFSSKNGTISFNGGLPTPGFNGSSGKIINVVFRVKDSGTASLFCSSAAVRANDGYGTNIFEGCAQARFNLVAKGVPVPSEPATITVPLPPAISSLTHPDSTKWYNNNNADFKWSITNDITGVNILGDQEPDTNPGTRSDGKITSYSYKDVEDGVWYFHIRARNSAGWGPVGHFQFNVDTANPENLVITELDREDSTNPKAKFSFSAEDKTSGIDHFELKLDNNAAVSWGVDGSIYETPFLESGKHILAVKTLDGAGNFITDSIEFTVDELNPPELTDYPEFLKAGEVLVIDGKTYSDSKVNLWLQKDKGDAVKFSVNSNGSGNFRFIADEKMEEGIYKAQAEVINKWEAKSKLSEPITIVVEKSEYVRVGAWLVTLFSVLMPILGLLLLIILVIWYFWHRFKRFRKRLNKEIYHAEASLHKAFDKLRKDVGKQIYLLEKAETKRELTAEERGLIRQLKKDLDDAEKTIAKEIRDIEKEVEKGKKKDLF